MRVTLDFTGECMINDASLDKIMYWSIRKMQRSPFFCCYQNSVCENSSFSSSKCFYHDIMKKLPSGENHIISRRKMLVPVHTVSWKIPNQHPFVSKKSKLAPPIQIYPPYRFGIFDENIINSRWMCLRFLTVLKKRHLYKLSICMKLLKFSSTGIRQYRHVMQGIVMLSNERGQRRRDCSTRRVQYNDEVQDSTLSSQALIFLDKTGNHCSFGRSRGSTKGIQSHCVLHFHGYCRIKEWV